MRTFLFPAGAALLLLFSLSACFVKPVEPDPALLPVEPDTADSHVGIRFRLPDEARVTVGVYDALQNIVLRPLKETSLSVGDHELSVAVGSLPSGTYSVRVQAILPSGETLFQQRTVIVVR